MNVEQDNNTRLWITKYQYNSDQHTQKKNQAIHTKQFNWSYKINQNAESRNQWVRTLQRLLLHTECEEVNPSPSNWTLKMWLCGRVLMIPREIRHTEAMRNVTALSTNHWLQRHDFTLSESTSSIHHTLSQFWSSNITSSKNKKLDHYRSHHSRSQQNNCT